MADTLAAALWLAERGMHVFDVDHPELPKCVGVRTREHNPDSCTERGKHPCGRWSEAATTDPQAVTAMFTGNPRNIGIACGPSRLLVVDEDALDEFARFCESIGQAVPDTFKVKTGKGWHYYFRQPEGVDLGNQEGALRGYGVNVRGVGGYVVGPGSVHQTGVMYLPDNPDAEILHCPAWLVAALHGQPKADGPFAQPDQPKDHSWWRDAEVIHHPNRHAALVAAAGYCRKVGLTRDGAIPTVRDVWRRCCPGDCPGHKPKPAYTWEQALARLDDIYTRYEAGEPHETGEQAARRIEATAAAGITLRRVKWLWDARLALGTLALLAGPEGLGKSILAYWITARITRGELPGEYLDTPRAVLVCATEDSWEHTIAPRLAAHGADLTRVYRIEVKTADDITLGLSLPRDLGELERVARETRAALLILDPLMSRLAESLDSHKDGEVRRALEPLVAVADKTGVGILGLIHHNKSGSTDPLQLVMASKAFTTVARSVHTVIKDPDDDTEARRLFGTPKNNLGRSDLPVMSFTVERWEYDTDDGPGDTGRLVWGEDVDGTIAEALRRAGADPEHRTATDEAARWLDDYMAVTGPKVASADIKRDAGKAGHSVDALKRARRKLKLDVVAEGFPRVTYWISAGRCQLEQTSRGDTPTALTAPTGQNGHQSVQLVQSEQTGVPLPRLDAILDAAPDIDVCDCGHPLDQHAAPGCRAPVVHQPPDLWSTP